MVWVQAQLFPVHALSLRVVGQSQVGIAKEEINPPLYPAIFRLLGCCRVQPLKSLIGPTREPEHPTLASPRTRIAWIDLYTSQPELLLSSEEAFSAISKAEREVPLRGGRIELKRLLSRSYRALQ